MAKKPSKTAGRSIQKARNKTRNIYKIKGRSFSFRAIDWEMTTKIKPNPEFKKKGLATHSFNVGLKCGHECKYCYVAAQVQRHAVWGCNNVSPTASKMAVFDSLPDPNSRIQKLNSNGSVKLKDITVMLCTTCDLYGWEQQRFNVGKKVIETMLTKNPEIRARILTKNDGILKDLPTLKKFKDQIIAGLSITALPSKQSIIDCIEPNTSPIQDRLKAINKMASAGIPVFGMLCPLMPNVSNSKKDIADLIELHVKGFGITELFCEGINPRSNGIPNCISSLQKAGFTTEAAALTAIRNPQVHSAYVRDLIIITQAVMKKYPSAKMNFLLYTKNMESGDMKQIKSAVRASANFVVKYL